jgi:hypothetical protein
LWAAPANDLFKFAPFAPIDVTAAFRIAAELAAAPIFILVGRRYRAELEL